MGNASAPSHGPDAVVTVFQNEYWNNTEGPRTRAVVVPVSPHGHWDRIYLSYREYPNTTTSMQDPFDRLCSASIAGVEVLRCTTPRTDMTLFHDITNYAALLPPGASVNVTADTGSYNYCGTGGLYVTVQIEFYGHAPADAGTQPYATVVPAIEYAQVNADGTAHETNVTFPTHPKSVTAEVQLTGHSFEEDWFLNDVPPPQFNVTVDGKVVGIVHPMPYVYAPAGFCNADYSENKILYWEAQHATNDAGLYTGSGYVPPYRGALAPDVVSALGGVHNVGIVGTNGGPYWKVSLSFLMGPNRP